MFNTGINPALRLLYLLKAHYKLVLFGGFLGAVVSIMVGLMSPKIFQSDALIEVFDTKTASMNFFELESTNQILLNKAAVVARSPQVLLKVADDMQKLGHFIPQGAFPHVYQKDLDARLELLMTRLRRLDNDNYAMTSDRLQNLSLDELSSLIALHLNVSIEPRIGAIKVNYEAGNPTTAQEICKLIVDRYIEVTTQIDRKDLTQQVFYLDGTIERQLEQIEELESQRQKLLESHPEMASSGTSFLAQQYLSKSDKLKQLESEFKSNDKLKDTYLGYLPGGDLTQGKVRGEIKERIVKELGEIEIEWHEYTKLKNYPTDHPDLQKLDMRRKTLRSMLSETERIGSSVVGQGIKLPEDSRNITSEIERLTRINREIDVQKGFLKDQLNLQVDALKEGLRVETDLDSINRKLSMHLDIIKELQGDREKVKMRLAGIASSARVQKPASLSIVPNSLSLMKRVLFGTFVSMVLVISLLFLVDLKNPLILGAGDFKALDVSLIGKVNYNIESMFSLASTIIGMRNRRELQKKSASVIIFVTSRLNLDIEGMLKEVGLALTGYGKETAIVVVKDKPTEPNLRIYCNMIGKLQYYRMYREEIAANYLDILKNLKSSKDFVLVAVHNPHEDPNQSRILENCDDVVYIAQSGVTDIAPIFALRPTLKKQKQIAEHGLLIA